MPTNNQNHLPVEISGSFELNGLRLATLSGREEIGRPFRYELTFVQGVESKGLVNPDDVLGRSFTVTLKDTPRGGPRYFNGVITEFAYTGFGERYHEYRAVLRPAFWLLTRNVDCRVLLNKSTPDIFSLLCKEGGKKGCDVQHELRLTAKYEPWDQRVQYLESDFDFLSRLLEHEGIYYYFEHRNGKHVLVLVDDVASLKSAPGYAQVSFEPHEDARDRLRSWVLTRSFESARVATTEYYFEESYKVSVLGESVKDPAARLEVFEYPAGAKSSDMERIAKVRAQRLQTMSAVVHAEGDAAGLAAGQVFSLTDHPFDAYNRKYLVLATQIELRNADPEGEAATEFSIAIEAIDARTQYRPARITPKPRISGTQTAVVSGHGSDEIITDKYGRVQVEFFWDREKLISWWARVAQGWAGRNFGAQYVPRVNDEVVLSFLDGDPDHPVIIGSVYNASHMPPYALPDQKTRSGIKTRSTPQGTAENFNEIRFEDKKGEEEVYIHAEKNLQVVVENDHVLDIGATKKDPGDRTVTIHNDDVLTVGRDRKVTAKRHLETTVTENETRTVNGARKTTVKENDEATISKKYTLTAGQEITLKVGAAQIVMKQDGTIEISGVKVSVSGTEVKVDGSGKMEVSGAQTEVSGTNLDLKGTKTAVAGSGALDLSSSGIASLKGTVTKIG